VRGVVGAAAFLTRVPLGAREGPSHDLARSVPWFPVVGALIGAFAGVVRWSAGLVLPDLASAILAVAAALVLTGALHEDGLADTVDGLAGGSDRDTALAIMRDSRTGAFGASALALALVMRASLLAAVAGPWVIAVAAGAGAASRGVVAVWMARAPAAAPGAAAAFGRGMTAGRAVVAGALGLAAALALGPAGSVAGGVAVLASWAVVAWAVGRIGGVTGDVLGSVQVVSELAFLGAMVAAPGWWRW
jgi:adenosylcobinamide-GDP ribazoletransferase